MKLQSRSTDVCCLLMLPTDALIRLARSQLLSKRSDWVTAGEWRCRSIHCDHDGSGRIRSSPVHRINFSNFIAALITTRIHQLAICRSHCSLPFTHYTASHHGAAVHHLTSTHKLNGPLCFCFEIAAV